MQQSHQPLQSLRERSPCVFPSRSRSPSTRGSREMCDARWRRRLRPVAAYARSGRPIRVASSATSAARSRPCSAHRGTLYPMPETVTRTVPIAKRGHPARAQGTPPLRTRSSSPDSVGRPGDWLAIACIVHQTRSLAGRSSRVGRWPGLGGIFTADGRPPSVVGLRRSSPRVGFGNGAVMRLGPLLQAGGLVVARLFGVRSTGALGQQPSQQVAESHYVRV